MQAIILLISWVSDQTYNFCYNLIHVGHLDGHLMHYSYTVFAAISLNVCLGPFMYAPFFSIVV